MAREKRLPKPNAPFTWKKYQAFVNDLMLMEVRRKSIISRERSDPGQIGEDLYLTQAQIYRERLPVYLLARCPICGGRVWESVDTFSLMGMGWWFNPSRGFGWYGRLPEKRYVRTSTRYSAMPRQPEASYHSECEHVCALTYGVNLNGIVPDDVNRWHLEIGAERPAVLAPFIEKTSCYAVLHTLPVGRYTDSKWQARYCAHFTTYFAADKAAYQESLAPQDPQSKEFYWPYQSLDYDLGKWVEAGKLYWLDTRQRTLPLINKPASAFPYGQLEGVEGRWNINRGKLELVPNTRVGWDLLSDKWQPPALKRIQEEALAKRPLRRLVQPRPPQPSKHQGEFMDDKLTANVNRHIIQGISKAKAGDFAAAIAEFNKAIALAPEFAPLYFNRGLAYEDQNNLSAALADYDRALALDNKNLRAYNNRALLKRAQGQLASAIEDWTAALQIDATFAEAYHNRAITYVAQNRVTDALRDFDRAIELAPQMAEAYLERAKTGSEQRSFQATAADFEQAIQLSPKNVKAYYQYALALLKQGDRQNIEKAVQNLNTAVKLTPKDAQLYQDRGVAYAKLAQLGENRERHYKRASIDYTAAIRYQSIYAYYLRAQAYEQLGWNDKAITDLENYLEKGGGESYGNEQATRAVLESLRQRF